MSIYLLLRFLHISAAIIFVGGLFARQAVRSLPSSASDVGAIVTLTRAAGRVERLIVIPGNILAIVFGVVLAFLTRAPLLGSILEDSRNWLLASTVILILLFPLVPIVFVPRGKHFEAALREATVAGHITPELRQQMDDPVVRRAHWAELIGVGLIVVLMVFKPI
ncbi:MAG TPA: DUF2269 family protein [Anaerolineales bacterium]|nr:DUF2269 family protein [Anaerolineales bacterium]